MRQKYYLQINYWRLLGIILVFGVTLFVLLLIILAYEESDQGYKIVYVVAGALFKIIAFPIILLSRIDILKSNSTFITGLILGALLWSVLVEVLFIKYGKKRNNNP